MKNGQKTINATELNIFALEVRLMEVKEYSQNMIMVVISAPSVPSKL